MANLLNIQSLSDLSSVETDLTDDVCVTSSYSAALYLSPSERALEIDNRRHMRDCALAPLMRKLRRPVPYRKQLGLNLSAMAELAGVTRSTVAAALCHHDYLELVSFGGQQNRRLVTEQARKAGYGHNVDSRRVRIARVEGHNKAAIFPIFYPEKAPSILWVLNFDGIRSGAAAIPGKQARLRWMLEQHGYLPDEAIADFAGCTSRGVRKARARLQLNPQSSGSSHTSGSSGSSRNPQSSGVSDRLSSAAQISAAPITAPLEGESSGSSHMPENWDVARLDPESSGVSYRPLRATRTDANPEQIPFPSTSMMGEEHEAAVPQARRDTLSADAPAARQVDGSYGNEKGYAQVGSCAEGDVYGVAEDSAGLTVHSLPLLDDEGQVEAAEVQSTEQSSINDLLDELLFFPNPMEGGEHAPAVLQADTESDDCEEGVLNSETDFAEGVNIAPVLNAPGISEADDCEEGILNSATDFAEMLCTEDAVPEKGPAEGAVLKVAEGCAGPAVQSPSPMLDGGAEAAQARLNRYAPKMPKRPAFSGLMRHDHLYAPESAAAVEEQELREQRREAKDHLLRRLLGEETTVQVKAPRPVFQVRSRMRDRYAVRSQPRA